MMCIVGLCVIVLCGLGLYRESSQVGGNNIESNTRSSSRFHVCGVRGAVGAQAVKFAEKLTEEEVEQFTTAMDEGHPPTNRSPVANPWENLV